MIGVPPMLNAKSKSELSTLLANLDISVPPRSEGRTKEHTERYAISFLLSTLNDCGRVNFPMSLIRRERPDFLLSVNGLKIGIEHTEAISQNEAQKDVLRDKIECSDVHFLSHAIPGEPKRSSKTLIEEILNDEAGEGWHGDAVEREWASAMSYSAKTKLTKVVKPGFERFQHDWLIIYDNWHLPALKLEEGVTYLSELLVESGAFQEFQLVFVLSGGCICEFGLNETKVYDAVNLWSSR